MRATCRGALGRVCVAACCRRTALGTRPEDSLVGQKGRGRPRSTSRKLQPDRQRTLVVGLSLLANTLPWSRAATVGTAAGRGSMNAVSACAPGLRAFEAAVSAVGPDKLVSENIAVNGADEQAVLHLVSTNEDIPIPQGVRLVAFGKASIAMARAAERKLGPALRTGIVISQPSAESAPESCSDLKSKVHVGSAGNLPDSAAVIAAGEALSIARGAREGEVLMVLVSGGGSALLPLPAEPLTLEDKLTTTRMMAAAGASITQLNTVRKHLSAVKGGQLAAAAHPARVVALILSDVIADPLDVIASGPTVPDTTTFTDALSCLRALDVMSIPPRVLRRLEDGAKGKGGVWETPKAGDARLGPTRVSNIVIGNNQLAARAALQALQSQGYQGRIHTLSLAGPVQQAAEEVTALARNEIAAAAAAVQASNAGNAGEAVAHKRCVILAGETTVVMSKSGTRKEGAHASASPTGGKGGRCSHMALLVARALRDEPHWCLVSAGTDGQDGPTDAAGACVDGGTWARGLAAGLDADKALDEFDSYSFFDKEGSIIRTGLTGTNVMDLHILLCHHE